MPRRKIKPDPEVERAIGIRLRELRDRGRYTQAEFAALVMLTRQELANIESGRTALSYARALIIAMYYGVDKLDTLAGLQPAVKAWPVDSGAASGLRPGALFSEVAAAPGRLLQPTEKDHIARLTSAREWAGLSPEELGDAAGYAAGSIRGVESGRMLPDAEYIGSIAAALNIKRHWLETGEGDVWDSDPFPIGVVAPPPIERDLEKLEREADFRRRRVAYHMALAEQVEAELRLAKAVLLGSHTGLSGVQTTPTKEKESVSACNIPLTRETLSLTSDGVKFEMPRLIARLRAATAERGSKALLAAALGVHRQCVTDWLSGKQTPGGETTLRLLAWVTAEEAKQTKSPAGAETPAEPKAQVRNKYENKTKSGPP